jgi:hypothetical protein
MNNSQNKIIKQDVLNSLKNNLNDKNVEDLINEFKNKSGLLLDINYQTQSYMWYV